MARKDTAAVAHERALKALTKHAKELADIGRRLTRLAEQIESDIDRLSD